MKQGNLKFLIMVMAMHFANINIVHCQTSTTFTRPRTENQKSVVTQYMGHIEVTITYNAPNVTSPAGVNRTNHIWGELVPYGMFTSNYPDWVEGGASEIIPWRAGSDENTTISFSHDIMIEGQKLPAGKYGLFMLVSKDSLWTIIFSKSYNSWGSFFYKQNEDALRIRVPARDNKFNEWLTFGFADRFLTRTIAYMEWEKKRVEFTISVPDINSVYLDLWRKEMRSAKGLGSESWAAAVEFCVTNNTGNWEEALTWSNWGLYAGRTFRTYAAKARVLEKLGRTSEADEEWRKAMESPSANLNDLLRYATSLLPNKKAFTIIDKANEKFNDNKGLIMLAYARAYKATNDKTNAIRYYDDALKKIPLANTSLVKIVKAEKEAINK